MVTCGDGFRHPSEECDDNDVFGGDGCDSTCNVEANFACTGGSTTTTDTCTPCPAGTSSNNARTACIVRCGDGNEDTTEECDDGDTTNGNGCSASCTIEDNYVCTGGTTTSPDTCTPCSGGLSPNAAKDT